MSINISKTYYVFNKKKWNKSPLLSIFAKPMTKLSNDMCLNYR